MSLKDRLDQANGERQAPAPAEGPEATSDAPSGETDGAERPPLPLRLSETALTERLEEATAAGPDGARFQAAEGAHTDPFAGVKTKIQRAVIDKLGPELFGEAADSDLTNFVRNAVEQEMALDRTPLTRDEHARIVNELTDDIVGYGPLEPFLSDDGVSEVMVNGYDQIYIERAGKIEETSSVFLGNDHLMRIIDKIVSQVGRRIDEASPMVDARLPDGSRVNAIIPPLSLCGPALTIRKFSRDPFSIVDLIQFGTITDQAADFLSACVRGKLNVLISGGSGSGKTTTLNALSSFIPNEERIVTVEDAAELQLRQIHVINLESRPANVEGKGGVSIRDLVINTLRMRPDRIVVGEVRSGEALDMLQAMNTGHDGSLTTLHANTPRDSISRLETLVLMAGMELPSRAIREQIASAINIIIQQNRMRDGTRKITYISEVTGIEGDQISLQDIFVFKQTGFENGKVTGFHTATGAIPRCMDTLVATGNEVPVSFFDPAEGSGFIRPKRVRALAA